MLYSLDGNGITDKGVGMLADALKVNQSLQSLRSATTYIYALHDSGIDITVASGIFPCYTVLMVMK